VAGAARSLPLDRVPFNHAVVLDGQVAGHWKRTLRSDAVIIEAALYQPFADPQARALQAAADRHGAFLGLPATVVCTKL
jgi:DNA glycosylase AlkZ-like